MLEEFHTLQMVSAQIPEILPYQVAFVTPKEEFALLKLQIVSIWNSLHRICGNMGPAPLLEFLVGEILVIKIN